MTEMSLRFNFDDFDGQIREALEENEDAMAEVAVIGIAEARRPGEIGSVVAFPTRLDDEPTPPEAA